MFNENINEILRGNEKRLLLLRATTMTFAVVRSCVGEVKTVIFIMEALMNEIVLESRMTSKFNDS
jgi:hypothetical protein